MHYSESRTMRGAYRWRVLKNQESCATDAPLTVSLLIPDFHQRFPWRLKQDSVLNYGHARKLAQVWPSQLMLRAAQSNMEHQKWHTMHSKKGSQVAQASIGASSEVDSHVLTCLVTGWHCLVCCHFRALARRKFKFTHKHQSRNSIGIPACIFWAEY